MSFDGVVYAHNGGKFDFHFILPSLVSIYGHDSLEILTIGSRIVRIKTPGPEFRDSYALLPKPLASIGDKRNINIDLLNSARREAHREEICQYLRQDCVALWDALQSFFREYGRELTLASTTFSLLRDRYGVKPPKTNVRHDSRFRPYYFAGRVQYWELGYVPGALACCDINSAFPWAMTFPHWFSPASIARCTVPKRYAEQSLYAVTCDSDGALPQRGAKGEVNFPVGRNLSFFVTGWELFAALRCGLVRNVRYDSIHQPTECRDFGDYVRHFYTLKQSAESPAERQFAKLLLNSPYGKFALNPRTFKQVRICSYDTVLPDPWNHAYDDIASGLSFWTRRSYPQGESDRVLKTRQNKREKLLEGGARKLADTQGDDRPMRFINVCTAASITGFVRAFLLESMHRCKGVVYCDTDSIVARDVSALRMGEGLGEWKIEMEFDGMWIGGKKLYAGRSKEWRAIEAEISRVSEEADTLENRRALRALEKRLWKTASKGVRLTPEQIVKVANGEAQRYAFDAPNYSLFSAPRFVARTITKGPPPSHEAAM